jgi:hypothetical protein
MIGKVTRGEGIPAEWLAEPCPHGKIPAKEGCRRCSKGPPSLMRIHDDPPIYIQVHGWWQRMALLNLMRLASPPAALSEVPTQQEGKP